MAEPLTVPVALFLAALVAVVAVGAWTDIAQRRIPNWLCAGNLALGLTFSGTQAGWQGVMWAALHVLVALLVAMALFAVRWIGAGDAKYYASMAAWLPLEEGLRLLVAVSLAGLLLLIVYFATRIRGRARRTSDLNSPFAKLPYGVAIGLGGLAAVVST